MNMRSMMSQLDPIKRRVLMMIGRAVVRAIDDSKGRQTLQVELLKGELRDQVERMQNYGFTSHPLPGADAAVVFVTGNREQGIAVAVDDRRYRLNLQPGEVSLYDDIGNRVSLLRDRIDILGTDLVSVVAPAVTVECDDLTATATATAEIEAPEITLTGNVTVAGNFTVTGGGAANISANVNFTGTVTANGKRIDETHRHTGVQAGGSNSGTVA